MEEGVGPILHLSCADMAAFLFSTIQALSKSTGTGTGTGICHMLANFTIKHTKTKLVIRIFQAILFYYFKNYFIYYIMLFYHTLSILTFILGFNKLK